MIQRIGVSGCDIRQPFGYRRRELGRNTVNGEGAHQSFPGDSIIAIQKPMACCVEHFHELFEVARHNLSLIAGGLAHWANLKNP